MIKLRSNCAGRLMLFSILVLGCSWIVAPCSFSKTILFEEDFENTTENWILEDGWAIKDDNGNRVLVGSDHSFATPVNSYGKNFSLKADVKLLYDTSSIFINFRLAGCLRYFIDFSANGLSLNKTYPCGTHSELEKVGELFQKDVWHTIEIKGSDEIISVLVNDDIKIQFSDPEPLLQPSTFAFEAHASGEIHVDNVIVSTDEIVSQNTWFSTGGPLGGLGYDIRIHPNNKNIMFVTDNYAGVVKSINSGKSWFRTNRGISVKNNLSENSANIFSLTIDPNDPDIIWAGTKGDGSAFGIFKSIDSGVTWEKKDAGIQIGSDPEETGLAFRGFTVQEGNSEIVYAQAEAVLTVPGDNLDKAKGRVYKTYDGGESWELIWNGNNVARYLIIDPVDSNILYLSTGIFDRVAYNSDFSSFSQGGEGILKSYDGGKTWQNINNGLTDWSVGSLRMHPTNSNILFAACGDFYSQDPNTNQLTGGLFRTIDGGGTWKKVLTGDNLNVVNLSPSNPDIVYTGSIGAFYRSTDGGNTWKQYQNDVLLWGSNGVNAGTPIDVTIDPNNSDILYANSYGGGVFRSIDGAKSWEDWSHGYTGNTVRSIHVPPGNTPAVYSIGRSGPYFSNDYGNHWNGIANGDANLAEWYCVAVHPTKTDIILISDEYYGELFRSANGGNNFTKILSLQSTLSTPNEQYGFKTISFSKSDPNVIYAGISINQLKLLSSVPKTTAIYKSTDTGMTFIPMPSLIDGTNVSELVVSLDNPNVVYAATSSGVFKTSNGGVSWDILNLGKKFISSIALVELQNSTSIIAGEVFGGIWISQDDGNSWSGPHVSGFSSPNPYITAIVKDPNSNDLYVSDLYSGVYFSEDLGATWNPFPDFQMSGLDNKAVTDLVMNDAAIYAGTEGGGVFSYMRKFDSQLYPPSIDILKNGKQIVILWESVSNATGYRLYYAPYPDATTIGNIDLGNALNLQFDANGMAFYVAIKSYNLMGESDFSNIEFFDCN